MKIQMLFVLALAACLILAGCSLDQGSGGNSSGGSSPSGTSGDYTVIFSANGGIGEEPSPQTGPRDFTYKMPSGSGLSRPGYLFGGWNMNSAGTGTTSDVGTSFNLYNYYDDNKSVTLYAMWVPTAFTGTFIKWKNTDESITFFSDGSCSYTGGWPGYSKPDGLYEISHSQLYPERVFIHTHWDFFSVYNLNLLDSGMDTNWNRQK